MNSRSVPCCAHHASYEPAPRPTIGADRHSSTAAPQNCQRPLPFELRRCAWTKSDGAVVVSGGCVKLRTWSTGLDTATATPTTATAAASAAMPAREEGWKRGVRYLLPAAYTNAEPTAATAIRSAALRPCACAAGSASGP